MPDDDIARLLPEPPPPRASRREAAIGAAMRRFDGVETPEPARPPIAWQRPAWMRMSRTQVSAFASIALVAVVGIPLALTSLQERLPAPSQPAASAPAVVQRVAPAPAAGSPIGHPSPKAAAQPSPAPSAPPEAIASWVPPAAPAAEPAPAPALPPQAVADRAAKPCADDDCEPGITVTGSRIPSVNMSSSSPVTVVAQEAFSAKSQGRMASSDESNSEDVIVTGSRRSRPAAAYRRGDWNACTVNDPAESLAGCKGLVDPGAKGVPGQAAARVADGLSLAWRGDLDGAITAFDAAIELQPRLAVAYLNRGLAYQRQGEQDRALADLNKAVRYAPYAARGYYNRSLLFRQKGDIDRARADEERAVDKDARYRAVVE